MDCMECMICCCINFRFGDFTTQSSTAEGLWFANGTLQASKVKLLSRTYAQVTMQCVTFSLMFLSIVIDES